MKAVFAAVILSLAVSAQAGTAKNDLDVMAKDAGVSAAGEAAPAAAAPEKGGFNIGNIIGGIIGNAIDAQKQQSYEVGPLARPDADMILQEINAYLGGIGAGARNTSVSDRPDGSYVSCNYKAAYALGHDIRAGIYNYQDAAFYMDRIVRHLRENRMREVYAHVFGEPGNYYVIVGYAYRNAHEGQIFGQIIGQAIGSNNDDPQQPHSQPAPPPPHPGGPGPGNGHNPHNGPRP
ncbi:MAG: hypothetical protein NTY45_08135 [Elusimicrobia bacterium]|nr:hypothetical protein [Elusimicrobiota bacterium]